MSLGDGSTHRTATVMQTSEENPYAGGLLSLCCVSYRSMQATFERRRHSNARRCCPWNNCVRRAAREDNRRSRASFDEPTVEILTFSSCQREGFSLVRHQCSTAQDSQCHGRIGRARKPRRRRRHTYLFFSHYIACLGRENTQRYLYIRGRGATKLRV